MSPILARYAASAYHLRQKPSGWCCSACAEWVWNQKNTPALQGEVLTPVGHAWPQLGEAAISGPTYFNVDFAQEVLTPQDETTDSPTRQEDAGVATSSTGEEGQGSSQATKSDADRPVPKKPTRKDWCRLSDIFVQAPVHCMQAKSAQILDWIEEFEAGLEPDTLGCWLANRIAECLEAEEEDTIGILACIEDLKMQETHVEKGQQNEVQSGLAAVSLDSWAHPAEAMSTSNQGKALEEESTRVLTMIKGKLVQPAEETTTQGTVIDFALASAAIASCIHVEVDWEAPRFTPEPGDYQEDQEAQEETAGAANVPSKTVEWRKGCVLGTNAKLEAYMIGHSVDVETVQTVLKKAKAEAQDWQKQRRAQYQKWLEGACAGGMRGLYKALRSPENVQARPYREHSGELRPHLRRQEWKAVWQPMPDNQTQQDPLFDQLAAGARLQLEQLGPLRDEVVAKVLGKMTKKAVGPDGLSAQMFRELRPDQVALVAQAFREWESTGYMPDTVTMTLVTLLAKKETEERPIGLTSYAYRAWCKTRYHLYDEWAKQYKAAAPWDRAIKGLSSLEVAVTRVLKGEMHRQSGKTGITLLLDLKGFYENVSHTALVEAAFRHQYPPLLLHGAMQ
ncbi:unnamed protein product, partial [Symbiodinium sp. CCMP2456]